MYTLNFNTLMYLEFTTERSYVSITNNLVKKVVTGVQLMGMGFPKGYGY